METLGIQRLVEEGRIVFDNPGIDGIQVHKAHFPRSKAAFRHGPFGDEFDVLVPGRNYQVFLTEYGDLGGLYVKKRNLHSFEVRSRRAGARGAFAFRVVALRADLKT